MSLYFNRRDLLKTQAHAIQGILKELKSSINLTLKFQILTTLSQVAPQDPRVLDGYKWILSDEKSQPLFPIVMQQLAGLKDPWLKKTYRSLVTHRNIANRLAALQVLHRVCDDQRSESFRILFSKMKKIRISGWLHFRKSASCQVKKPRSFLRQF